MRSPPAEPCARSACRAAWLEVSPDGSLLAAAGGTEIVLLDEATFNEVRRLQGHGDQVRVIRFSPNGAQLASGSEDRTTIVWDVTTGERRDLLQGSPTGVWGVGFGPDGNTLYTSGGQAVLTWDLTGERRFIRRLPLVEPAAPWGPSAGGAEGSPAGDAVAYTGCLADDGPALLQFLDLGTGRAGPLIDTGHRCYGSFVWRPDGALYATAGYDGFVRVWDWHTGELIVERHVAPMLITGLDYTGDGRRLVVAEREGTTYAIDAETLEPDGKSIELGKPVANVYASPDNHTAIVLTTGGFSLVDLDNGRVVRDGEADDPFAGDFSPDGHRFAVGSGSGGVRMLDVDTGEWAGPPRAGHNGLIYSVDYAEDGATFVTGSDDRAVILWDARTGAALNRMLPGRLADGGMHPENLADGHTVLISSSGGPVYTIDTRTEHWVDVACAIAGRNLTEIEWTDTFDTRPYRETCPAGTNA